MKDERKTKKQLIKELVELRQRIAKLEERPHLWKASEAELKQAEKGLASSEEFLNSVIEQSPVSLWISDSEGTLIKLNQSCRELFGATDEEAVGKYNLLKDNLIEEQGFMPLVENVFEKGEIARFTIDYDLPRVEHVKVNRATHRILDVTVSPIKNMHGKVTNAMVQHKDITERRRAEEELRKHRDHLEELVEERTAELRKAQERFSGIFDSSKDAIGYATLEGVLVDVNDSFCTLTGYSKDELLTGRKYQDITPKEYHEYEAEIIERIIRTGKPQEYEKEYIRKDGSRVPISLTVFVVKGIDGTAIGVAAILKDITERKEMQEQLVRQEKLTVLGQLAGSVGHELRNPLGVISNAVYFLQTILTDADETTKEYLELISSEVHNSERIISDILDLSRTKLAEREETIVSDLIARLMEKQPPPKKVKVTTKLTPDLPLLFVDPQQIEQVLGNLVTNAYDAMPDGGKLTINAQETSEVFLKPPRSEGVALSISDTGCGISKENMDKLFEPLFTTKSRGIGLGLAVSKNLVEVNEGSIEVESKMGKGSTFTVILPKLGADSMSQAESRVGNSDRGES